MAVGALFFLVIGINAEAATIEWADFTKISVRPPTNGFVSSNSGGLSFDVTFYSWSANAPNTSSGAGSSTSGALDWDAAFSLHGAGITSYSVGFDNIFSHDGSLYFGAVWLKSNTPVTVRAYDESDQMIDLNATSFIDTFYGDGPTSWNGATGQLTMYGGNWSEHGGIVDLSDIGIDRLLLSYSTRTLDGFEFGIANNEFVVPIPSSMLLFGTGIAALAGFKIRKKNK